jgi:hypothetical protein
MQEMMDILAAKMLKNCCKKLKKNCEYEFIHIW